MLITVDVCVSNNPQVMELILFACAKLLPSILLASKLVVMSEAVLCGISWLVVRRGTPAQDVV